MAKKPQPIPVAADPDWTLARWLDFVKEQISKYGSQSVMYTDAGHNNTELMVVPEGQVRSD